jgi:hypothetical protein
MKRATLTFTLFILCMGMTWKYAWAEEPTANTTVDVTGTWEGINYTSQVSGQRGMKLFLTQKGKTVSGSYSGKTGVIGKGMGLVSGLYMEIQWENTPRPNDKKKCEGKYKNRYLISEDQTQLVWVFTGKDCLGEEKGYGYATKVEK